MAWHTYELPYALPRNVAVLLGERVPKLQSNSQKHELPHVYVNYVSRNWMPLTKYPNENPTQDLNESKCKLQVKGSLLPFGNEFDRIFCRIFNRIYFN